MEGLKNESFEQAAIRELFEETGLTRTLAGPQIASRTFTMMLPSGETVFAEERFFMINANTVDPTAQGGVAMKRKSFAIIIGGQ